MGYDIICHIIYGYQVIASKYRNNHIEDRVLFEDENERLVAFADDLENIKKYYIGIELASLYMGESYSLFLKESALKEIRTKFEKYKETLKFLIDKDILKTEPQLWIFSRIE
ncbi:MAG: hypothetical protein ACTSRZ_20140 [Promethearchaeota archaeon]